MSKLHLSVALLALTGLSFTAVPVVRAADDLQARIIDGTLRPVAEYPMVAQLFIGDGACTGTLIGERHVLTAGHCFFDENSNRVTNTGTMTVVLGGNAYGVAQVTVHPTYVPRNSACNAGEVDAAVMELSSTVSGITPMPLVRSAPSAGNQVLLVGFGVQGTGPSGENGTFPAEGYVNIGYTQIEEVADNLYVNWYFDPDNGESNTAGGDSGGPAFIDVNGTRYIHSITCGGTGNAGFDTWSTNTRADTIASWVDAVVGNELAPITEPTMQVKKAIIDIGDNDNYTFNLRGNINVGASFSPKGKSITITVAGHSETFVLTRGGYAYRRRGDDYVEFTGKMQRGAYKKSVVKFDIGLVDSEALYEAIISLLPEDEIDESYRLSVPVVIDLNGVQYTTTLSLRPLRGGERWVP